MNYPKKVRLVEVGPRDGLQNEAKPVSGTHRGSGRREEQPSGPAAQTR